MRQMSCARAKVGIDGGFWTIRISVCTRLFHSVILITENICHSTLIGARKIQGRSKSGRGGLEIARRWTCGVVNRGLIGGVSSYPTRTASQWCSANDWVWYIILGDRPMSPRTKMVADRCRNGVERIFLTTMKTERHATATRAATASLILISTL